MSIMSKRIEIASGNYRALLEYKDIDNATSSCDSEFCLALWDKSKPEHVNRVEIGKVDILYLTWLFRDIVGEMEMLKGAKIK